MEKKHGHWVILRSSEVYRDGFIRVASDDVIRPDGQPGHYATITVKPADNSPNLDAQLKL